MTTIKWALVAVGLVLAAFFGLHNSHRRDLERERERAERAEREAIDAGNAADIAQAQATIMRIDRDLARLRQSSVLDRIQAALDEARRRRAASGAG